MINLIRYPGSKAKLAGQIWETFPPNMLYGLWMHASPIEYREPFFGAGAVGFNVLRELPTTTPVWLNDLDFGMYALWSAVLHEHEELIRLCTAFKPSPEYFYKFKAEDGDDTLPLVKAGFRKLALHRMSFSGLGAKAGGPIGGRNQSDAAYCIGCRWNPEHIKKNVAAAHRLLGRFDSIRITRMDFQPLVDSAPEKCFVYLDPPYYEKGPALYTHAMGDADHHRLAASLRRCPASWVLSYDDHPFVRALYAGHEFRDLHATYSMGVSRTNRPKNREVLIFPTRATAELTPTG